MVVEGGLVSGTWNYPVQLILLLLIGDVAAGMWSGGGCGGVGGDYDHGGDECGCGGGGGGKGWAKGGWCLGPGTIQYNSSFYCSPGLSLLVCGVVVMVVTMIIVVMSVAVVVVVVGRGG